MITLLLRYSLTLRVTIGFCRRTGLRQWANSLHTFDRFVFPTQDLVGSLQTSGGLVNVAVVLVESGLGSSGGVGSQVVSQLGSFVQFVDGRTEHFVLLPVSLRRVEVRNSLRDNIMLVGLLFPHPQGIIRRHGLVPAD